MFPNSRITLPLLLLTALTPIFGAVGADDSSPGAKHPQDAGHAAAPRSPTPASAPAQAHGGGFDPWNEPARYALTWRIDLTWAAGRSHDAPRLWIPLPADNDHQRVRSLAISAPGPYQVGCDTLGNRMLYLTPRIPTGGDRHVEIRCVVERRPCTGSPGSPVAGTPLDPGRYLAPQRRIPLDGPIRALARRTIRGTRTTGERIRALYDEVTRSMRYSKHGTGWGRGDAAWACRSGFGNCTDFHSLLIGMCRSSGIPARFVIGFPMPASPRETTVAGYHCWAEVFDPDRGWIPVDASEAQKTGRRDDYFGKLPADRIELTVGRDLTLVPPQSGPALNFFVYPYAELAGQPAGRVPWTLRARRCPR